MGFEVRKYKKSVHDWDEITLIQIIPCFNIGKIRSLGCEQGCYNIAIGWLFWVIEWSSCDEES